MQYILVYSCIYHNSKLMIRATHNKIEIAKFIIDPLFPIKDILNSVLFIKI